jgi:hypothetical protein
MFFSERGSLLVLGTANMDERSYNYENKNSLQTFQWKYDFNWFIRTLQIVYKKNNFTVLEFRMLNLKDYELQFGRLSDQVRLLVGGHQPDWRRVKVRPSPISKLCRRYHTQEQVPQS